MEAEHVANGIQWDDHDIRLELVREANLLIKKYWTESIINFTGKYYNIRDAKMEPKPLQKLCSAWNPIP